MSTPITTAPALSGDWRLGAACRGAPYELFDDNQQPDATPPPRAVDAARRYCAGCPVLASCAEFATAIHGEGVWAGQWRHLGERTDLLAVATTDEEPPEGLTELQASVWAALPTAGLTTTPSLVATLGLDQKSVSKVLRRLQLAGHATSVKKGLWARKVEA